MFIARGYLILLNPTNSEEAHLFTDLIYTCSWRKESVENNKRID